MSFIQEILKTVTSFQIIIILLSCSISDMIFFKSAQSHFRIKKGKAKPFKYLIKKIRKVKHKNNNNQDTHTYIHTHT